MHGIDSFSAYHPLAEFLYFSAVIAFSMFFMHPLCLLISLFCACLYYITLEGSKAKKLIVKFIFPVILITSVMNPLLSHEGQTILFYLPSKNPLTLESVLYGVCAGLMLASVMLWFFCFSAVMTSDKFVYLFSRFSPSLSLMLSMTLRFIPRFKNQFETVSEAQNSLDIDEKKSKIQKAKTAVWCFVSVISWSLENAVETADSMKSRGYGTTKRTAYSIYRFEERDKIALCFIISCAVFIVCGAVSGALKWRFYPTVKGALTPLSFILFAAYSAFCIMPVYLNEKEKRLWKRLRSEI